MSIPDVDLKTFAAPESVSHIESPSITLLHILSTPLVRSAVGVCLVNPSEKSYGKIKIQR